MCESPFLGASFFREKMRKAQTAAALTLFFALILCQAALSQEDNWAELSSTAKINVSVSAAIMIDRESDSQISYVTANLSLFPKNDEFQSATISTYPNSSRSQCCFVFRWDSPNEKFLSYIINADVTTKRRENPVNSRVLFPILNNLSDYIQYLNSSGKIIVDDDIAKKASEITNGSDNLFEAVSRLNFWVNNNVKYDISYGNVVEDSVWVFENRRGTCDEFATLFIAMCRSIGIPARYVSGMAYSSLPEISGFGNHAWAEAYFPGYGWLSFDQTYGQAGYVDASHIKFMDSAESDIVPASYLWKSFNAELSPGKIETNATLIENAKRAEELMINASLFDNEIGLSSYDVVEAQLYNPTDHYIARRVSISRSDALTIIDEPTKDIVLAPYETAKLSWIVKTKELERGSIYSIPVSIYSESSLSTVVIRADELSKSISYEEAVAEAEQIASEKRQHYLAQISAECKSAVIYAGENASISCTLRNVGNTPISGASVCLGTACRSASFSIMQSLPFSFPVYPEKSGNLTTVLTIENGGLFVSKKISYLAIERPKISIVLNQSYIISEQKKNPTVDFAVIRNAGEPGQIMIRIIPDGVSDNVSLNSGVKFPLLVSAELNRKLLISGENNLTIEISFSDQTGSTQLESAKFQVYLRKSIAEIAEFYLNRIGASIRSLFLGLAG